MSIHPTAIIGKNVTLAEGCTVGAYSLLQGHTQIGRGTIVDNHVTIGSDYGRVTIGENNHVWPGAVLGVPPQDLSYKGEQTELIIGNKNEIREFVTINIGTKKGTGITRIGNNNMLMAYTHLGHDCLFSNNIIVANSCQFGGHVIVEDNARIGGMTGVAQFVRVGKFAYVGGGSAINKDIIPYTIAHGNYATCRVTNKIGLQRSGLFTPEQINNINRAVRAIVMGDRTVEQALEKVKAECGTHESITYFIDFIRKSELGVAR